MVYIFLMVFFVIMIYRYQLQKRYIEAFKKRFYEKEVSGSISILQPILSGDPLLPQMLRANIEQTSDAVRFIWLVDEDDYQARKITREVKALSPQRIKILLCPKTPAEQNPKVFKLRIGIDHIHSEYVAVLDDDAHIDNKNLLEAMAALSENDLYTGLPVYQEFSTIPGRLVSAFVNSSSALTYLTLAHLQEPLSINGMFYVAKTETLRSYQVFERTASYLCDDLAVAALFQKNNLKIIQGIRPVFMKTFVDSWSQYFSIMKRWFLFSKVLFKKIDFESQWKMIYLLLAPMLLVWMVLVAPKDLTDWLIVAILYLVFRYSLTRKSLTLLERTKRDTPLIETCLSDILQPIHLASGFLSNKIIWRSHKIKVKPLGLFEYQRETPR